LKGIPSLFVWNPDETRIWSLKRQRPSQVIVAKDTPPGTITVDAVRDDVQWTLFMVIIGVRQFNSPSNHFKKPEI
jgi:hypothetical protein